MGVGGIADSSYEELYKLRGEDISAYFRIIHWTEILRYFSTGGLEYWLFGYGGGFTPEFTSRHLVPHNDYLKSFAEFGLLPFLAFAALVFAAVRGLRNPVQRSLFLVVAIYFFSENLLNSFASMALAFGFAGLMWQPRERRRRMVGAETRR
jgi:O-antigen ligase